MTSPDPKTATVALLRSIETGDPAAGQVLNPGKYIQHNLGVADGVQGFAALLQALPPGSTKVQVVRAFRDGDFIFTHSNYEFFGPKVGFDVFRFEDGRIVEHWDNLQVRPEGKNPSGRTMTDGPTEASDLGKTAENKALARGFVETVMVGGNLTRLLDFIDEHQYVQHNPLAGDGVSGLKAYMAEKARQGISSKYVRLHQVLGEGNFVLTMSEGVRNGKPISYYDLFRLENGKIVEHWDTIEEIPPRGDWKNGNGKF